MKIKVVLPALIHTEELKAMTDIARRSIHSFDNCIEVIEDNTKYNTMVAGAWNALLDQVRGTEYDFVMIACSDMQLDPLAIDYAVRYLEELEQDITTFECERDLDKFKDGFGQREFTLSETTGKRKDPACIMFRKGVIEKVGRIDEEFKMEFVERDYLYRCQLAGYDWMQPDVVLMYHPPHSGTIGNDVGRLQTAHRKYTAKWGGDVETYRYPYNDIFLDWTFTGEYK